jgi:hypothetical protein
MPLAKTQDIEETAEPEKTEELWGQFIELEQPIIPINEHLVKRRRDYEEFEKEDKNEENTIKVWVSFPFLKKREFLVKPRVFLHCSLSIILFYLFFALYL